MTPLELLEAHQYVAHRVVRGFWAPGLDVDDLLQEALIGVWEAAEGWDASLSDNFEGFAGMCARRQVMQAVTAARRLKHQLLNDSVRDVVDGNGEPRSVIDTIAAPCPFERLFDEIDRAEQLEQVNARAARITATADRVLSPLERRALMVVVNREGYAGDKQVDNAAQRAKRKLREAVAA